MKYIFSILFILLFTCGWAQDEDYVSLQDRLKSNVFVKVEASNTDCFVGEPIIVTYKLYSALASESSILKNPVFDGFDVKDLKGGADHIASRESVDGVKFDVHTLLRLQLTPRRAGRLTLGTLTVRNRVKLVNTNGTEDPILDGVEEGYTLNNGYFTLPVSSVPITVLVTALPGSGSTPSTRINGLVGDFKMDVRLSKKLLAPGEQAELNIMITGKGDFSKIEQPDINWPDAADVQAARVDEDKTQKKDGGGFKSFTIPFTINSPGRYSIPSIRFSFFDALNARYKTITNIPIEFSVVKEGGTAGTTSPADSGMYHNRQYFWTGLVIVLVIALLTMLLVRKKKKHRAIPRVQQPASKHSSEVAAPVALSVNGALQAAAGQLHQDGSQFSTSLKQGILQYLESRFGLPASSYSTELMQQTLTRHQVPESLQTALRQLLDEIDINIYSGGGVQTNKKQLLDQAMVLLQQL